MLKILLWLTATAMFAAEPVTLTIQLKGFKSDKGTVRVALFDSEAAFPKADKAMRKEMANIAGGTATVVLSDLKPGTYAVAAYHDANGNGKMDTNFIGIPKEPTGVSNDAKARMGPPSFKDAKFSLTATNAITITMQ